MNSDGNFRERLRNFSEPSCKVMYCSNHFSDRSRKTDLDYERGKDKLAHWIGFRSYEEVNSHLPPKIPLHNFNLTNGD